MLNASGQASDQSVADLKSRADAAQGSERVTLSLEYAHRQLEEANNLYSQGDVDKAAAEINEVVAYSRQAADAASASGKRLKQTEIELRKLEHRMRDIGQSLSIDDRPPVEKAVQELEHVRADLLARMFGRESRTKGQVVTKRILWYMCVMLLWGLVVVPVASQIHDRDPMTEAEVDQMREAADFPNKRLELMVGFAKERMATIELLRGDPTSAAKRPGQIHDLLQDFIALLDETDDNIDMYASHNADLRKGLKLLIEANSEWTVAASPVERAIAS